MKAIQIPDTSVVCERIHDEGVGCDAYPLDPIVD
jgi:hypothetical protein